MRLALLQAVAAHIAAAELPGVPAPVVSYHPLVKLTDLTTPVLQVLPAARVTETETRSEDADRWSVLVVLRQKLAKDKLDDLTAIDAVLALGESVWDALRRGHLRVGSTRFVWQSSETVRGADAGYAPEHYETLGVVSCIYRVTYEAMT